MLGDGDPRAQLRKKPAGEQRKLRATGEIVFSGCYGVGWLPGIEQPMVHVTFAPERGNVQVLLKPIAHPDASFSLRSGPGRFGQPGASVVVRGSKEHHAARVALHESFHLYLDDLQPADLSRPGQQRQSGGVLRTNHVLTAGPATALRLHYRMTL